MKNISPLVQTKTGLLTLAMSMALVGGTAVLGVQFVNHQIQVAQRAELNKKLNFLMESGSFKWSSLRTSVADLAEQERSQQRVLNLVEFGGQRMTQQQQATVKQALTKARQVVQQDTQAVQAEQQKLQQFVTANKDFVSTLASDDRAAINSFLSQDIPSQVAALHLEEQQQHRSPF